MNKPVPKKQLINTEFSLSLLVAAVFFMENLDITIMTTAIPAIANDFFTAPINISIAMVAYLITIAIFIPISGWLADFIGGRVIFMLAIAIFTLASLLCAISTNLIFFTLSRILQGLGGAMMVPVGRLIVLRQTAKKNMIKTIAILTWPALFAPVLGPTLGGWITTHWGWPWIFLINLPIGVLALLLSHFIVKPVPQSVARFDITGFIMISISLMLLMLGIELLVFKIVSFIFSLILLSGGVTLLIFVFYYFKSAKNPLFKLNILTVNTFNTAIFSGSIFSITISTVPFILPLMFQLSFGWSPIKSGTMLLWLFLGNLLMKIFTTSLINWFSFKSILIFNTLLIMSSFILCMLITNAMAEGVLIIIMLFCGMVRSLQFTTYNTLCFSDILSQDLRDANTLFSTVQQISIGLGISLGAFAILMGEWLQNKVPLSVYQCAFLIIGLFSLITLIQLLKLLPDAGQTIRNIIPEKNINKGP